MTSGAASLVIPAGSEWRYLVGMEPTIGRIVHYTEEGSEEGLTTVRPALIVELNGGGTVCLRVFGRETKGDMSRASVEHSEAEAGSSEARGKWSWPKRT